MISRVDKKRKTGEKAGKGEEKRVYCHSHTVYIGSVILTRVYTRQENGNERINAYARERANKYCTCTYPRSQDKMDFLLVTHRYRETRHGGREAVLNELINY